MIARNIPVKHKNSWRAIDRPDRLAEAVPMQGSLSVGKRIAAARKRRGMTQEQFGARFERGQSWVSKLEDDKIPATIELMQQVARVLGVPSRDLIPPESTAHENTGSSDCIVTRWHPPAQGDESGAPFLDPVALAPGARKPVTFHVPHDRAASFGFPRGTVLIVDYGSITNEGELGIATMQIAETGQERTILGRRLGDYLVGPNFAANPTDRTYVDPEALADIFPVVSWFRAPGITDLKGG